MKKRPTPEESNPTAESHFSAARLKTNNHILNSLPEEDLERLLPDLRPVELSHGKILFQSENKINYICFPDTAMVSIVAGTAEGESVEAGVIGCEGMAGFNILLGADSTPNENIIQLPGDGHLIPAAAAIREFMLGGAFRALSLRYIHAVLIQLGQVALCNRLHSIERRVARRLLMFFDHSGSDELRLTQECLAFLLGTNRVSITYAAVALQNLGAIKYKRGRIKVTDRKGLEYAACDCYQVIKREYESYR